MQSMRYIFTFIILISGFSLFPQGKYIWTGAVNEDYFNAANWEGNQVPGSADTAVIPNACLHYPAEYSENELSLQSLEIDYQAKMVLPEDNSLTFNCAGPVKIFSHDTLHGIFYHHLSNISIRSEIFFSANQFRAFGSPVQNAFSDVFSGSVLYEFDPFENQWLAINSPSEPLSPGKGFFAYRNEDFTYVLEGNSNEGDVEVPLEYAECRGNYFASNPFTCPIDWDAVTQRNNVDKAIYVWSTEEANYQTWNGHIGNAANGIIQSGDAFFVKVEDEDAGLVLGEEAKVSDTEKEVDEVWDNVTYVECRLQDGHYSDVAYLAYAPEFTDEYDGEYDAENFSGYVYTPDIYTVTLDYSCGDVDTLPYAINALHYNTTIYDTIPLYIRTGDSTHYSLRLKSIAPDPVKDDNYMDLYVLDNETNSTTQLTEEYTDIEFSAPANSLLADRFYIIADFYNAIAEEETPAFNLFASAKHLIIDNPRSKSFDLTIYDLLGRELYAQKLQPGRNNIALNAEHQYIIVRIIDDRNVQTRKIYFP